MLRSKLYQSSLSLYKTSTNRSYLHYNLFSKNLKPKSLFSTTTSSFSTFDHVQKDQVNSSTIDADEIAKFGAMSEGWWDPYGNCRLLHSLNLPRVEYILNSLKNGTLPNYPTKNTSDSSIDIQKPILENLKVLDVGCGGGLLSESLARLGAKVTAIDAASQNISIAKLHQLKDPLLNDKPDRLQYFNITSHELLAEKGPSYFDVVCSLEVIEHVNEPKEFLNSLSELVKPGCPVFLSTINKNALSYILTIGFAEHILNLVPVGTHHYEKYIRPEDLRSMMSLANLTTHDMSNINFNPISQQWNIGSTFYTSFQSQEPGLLATPPVNYIVSSTKNTD